MNLKIPTLLSSLTIHSLIFVPAASAATIIDNLYVEAGRATSTNGSTGTGTTFGSAGIDTGYFTGGGTDSHAVFIFQMTATSDGANIEGSNFTVSQTLYGPAPTGFVGDLHVVRTSSSASPQNSDYETSALLVKANFTGTTAAALSLDTAAQDTLTTWLQTNWVADDYIFFSIQTDPINPAKQGSDNNVGFRYGNNNNGGSSDSVFSVTVPEPSGAAIVGLGGMLMLAGRRRH
ncbi:PEP-CTERM sorting domain-containing protein [Haloferula sp.]|uniref:PEP-CTERM sorting domain-containing protein n=1 Tax=Haloferula sp. TaxID=2497595 RepID=UPI003C725B2F